MRRLPKIIEEITGVDMSKVSVICGDSETIT